MGPFPSLFKAANWVRAKFLLLMGSTEGWPYNTGIGTVIPVTIDASGDWSAFQNPKFTVVASASGKSSSVSVPAVSGLSDLNAYLTYVLAGDVTLDLSLTASNMQFTYYLGSFEGTGYDAQTGVEFQVSAPTNFSKLSVTVTAPGWTAGLPVSVSLQPLSIDVLGQNTPLAIPPKIWKGTMLLSNTGTDAEFLLRETSLYVVDGVTYQITAQIIDEQGNVHKQELTMTNEELTTAFQFTFQPPPGGGQGLIPVVVQYDIPEVGEVHIPGLTVKAVAVPASKSEDITVDSPPTDDNGVTSIGFPADKISPNTSYRVTLSTSGTYETEGETITVSGSTTFSALGSFLLAGTDIVQYINLGKA